MFDITNRIIKDNADVFNASLYETINSAIKPVKVSGYYIFT